ncbi:hypothetical protein OV208_17510 [Corallococcus sp. bb12-1]|uniref:hypothetical protein n=1 Tax=Corallococcus sp. bb12-1 TaxID=2996784 RepID=UPI00226EA7A0|nr:hypothetical protein [Corallococcus sp. bb12-1]MCY1043118.1 hypothetical protein [Corallococcus sp. bb12-1]
MSCFATFATLLLAAADFSSTGGLQLLFQFASGVNFRFLRPAGSFVASAPSSDFRRFFSKGSGFYFFAAFRVNRFLVSFFHRFRPACCLPDFLSVGRGFYHRRARCQLRVDCPIFLSGLLSPRSTFRASARASG